MAAAFGFRPKYEAQLHPRLSDYWAPHLRRQFLALLRIPATNDTRWIDVYSITRFQPPLSLPCSIDVLFRQLMRLMFICTEDARRSWKKHPVRITKSEKYIPWLACISSSALGNLNSRVFYAAVHMVDRYLQ